MDHGDLESNTERCATEDLVADPLAGAGSNVQRIDQARGDGRDGRAAYHQRRRDAGLGDATARDDGAKRDGQDDGEVSDAGIGGVDVVDALEVDGQVVDEDEVAASEEESVQGIHPDGLTLHQPRHDHGALSVEELPRGEGDSDQEKADEQADDLAGVPRVSLSTVLQGQDVADDTAHDQCGADRVHLKQLLLQGSIDGLGAAGSTEEEQDDGRRDTSDGEVNVEAPAPGHAVGESTADEGAHDGRNTVRSSDDAGEHRPLLGFGREGDEGVGARSDSGGADTGDGASHDQSGRVGRYTADQATELENEDGDQEAGLQGEVLVDLAP